MTRWLLPSSLLRVGGHDSLPVAHVFAVWKLFRMLGPWAFDSQVLSQNAFSCYILTGWSVKILLVRPCVWPDNGVCLSFRVRWRWDQDHSLSSWRLETKSRSGQRCLLASMQLITLSLVSMDPTQRTHHCLHLCVLTVTLLACVVLYGHYAGFGCCRLGPLA